MRSKEDILNQRLIKIPHGGIESEVCLKYDAFMAMELFAMDRSIEYANWRMQLPPDALVYVIPQEPIPKILSYTPTELYNLFLRSINK